MVARRLILDIEANGLLAEETDCPFKGTTHAMEGEDDF